MFVCSQWFYSIVSTSHFLIWSFLAIKQVVISKGNPGLPETPPSSSSVPYSPGEEPACLLHPQVHLQYGASQLPNLLRKQRLLGWVIASLRGSCRRWYCWEMMDGCCSGHGQACVSLKTGPGSRYWRHWKERKPAGLYTKTWNVRCIHCVHRPRVIIMSKS